MLPVPSAVGQWFKRIKESPVAFGTDHLFLERLIARQTECDRLRVVSPLHPLHRRVPAPSVGTYRAMPTAEGSWQCAVRSVAKGQPALRSSV